MEKTTDKKHFLTESIIFRGILCLKTKYELMITHDKPGVYFVITQTSSNRHTGEEITNNIVTHAWADLPDLLMSIEDCNVHIAKIIDNGANK
jgi:hypothetical protein